MYNCIDITSLGSSSGSFLGIIPVVKTGFGYRALVVLSLGGSYVASMGRYGGAIGRE